ncbi:glutamate 5-kinase [Patescibacteria group bacterium]|nr:glutamate 5-kinase [Patescibacteria group bacterium]
MIKNRVIIKVGTNVLTNDSDELDYNVINSLTEQISSLKKKDFQVVLVASGAVAAGKKVLPQNNVKDHITKRQIFAAVGQIPLNQALTTSFEKNKITSAQVLLTRNIFVTRDNYDKIINVLDGLLTQEVVPIINENDVVSLNELSFGDNDALAASLSIMLDAEKLLILSNIDGLYDRDPEEKESQLISEVNNIDRAINKMCSEKTSRSGLGGMLSKVKSIRLATRAGVESFIIRGKKEEVITKTVQGHNQGTRFTQQKNVKLDARDRWLLIAQDKTARLQVDDGAREALKKRKSLLAVGIVSIHGNFEPNTIVEIVDKQKELIGYGLTIYSSKELQEALTKKKRLAKYVIHADNLTTI